MMNPSLAILRTPPSPARVCPAVASRYASPAATAFSWACSTALRTPSSGLSAHSSDTLLDGENVTSNAATGSAIDPSARGLATTLRPSTCSGSHRPDANLVPPAVDGTTNRPYRTAMSSASTSPDQPDQRRSTPGPHTGRFALAGVVVVLRRGHVAGQVVVPAPCGDPTYRSDHPRSTVSLCRSGSCERISSPCCRDFEPPSVTRFATPASIQHESCQGVIVDERCQAPTWRTETARR